MSKCKVIAIANQKGEYSGRFWFFRNYPLGLIFEYINFADNKSLLHRPYIVRFTILSLLFVPSTKPFDNGLATEFSTAARSFSNPNEKRESFFKFDFLYFSMKRYNRGMLLHSYISRNSRIQLNSSLN